MINDIRKSNLRIVIHSTFNIFNKLVLPTVPDSPLVATTYSPLLTSFLFYASSIAFFNKMSAPINEPTSVEWMPLCMRRLKAAHSLGVTASTGHLGLCLATVLAVIPLCVKTMIKLALTLKEALTAQLAIVSSMDHSGYT